MNRGLPGGCHRAGGLSGVRERGSGHSSGSGGRVTPGAGPSIRLSVQVAPGAGSVGAVTSGRAESPFAWLTPTLCLWSCFLWPRADGAVLSFAGASTSSRSLGRWPRQEREDCGATLGVDQLLGQAGAARKGSATCQALPAPRGGLRGSHGQAGARRAPGSPLFAWAPASQAGPHRVSYSLLVKGTPVICGAGMGTLSP